MKLRIKDPVTGQQHTLSLADDATSAELQAQIRSVGWELISEIKSATPPFSAYPMDQVALLRDLGIRHGDSLLIVRGGDKPAAAAAETQGNQGQVKEQITAPVMVKRSIPDDNSCLFNAVAYVLMNGRKDQSRQLRQLIAETVRKHPDLYSEVMLGQPVDDYCRIITGSNSWGGAIELSIFAQHFQTEIVSIDVETCKPYHFGEGSGYDRRVFVLYSGIHYDALAQTSHPANASLDKTVFDATDDLVLIQALSVAEQEQRAKRFTNTNTFTLRCMDCGTALVGQAEAQNHCKLTGHLNFSEYSQ